MVRNSRGVIIIWKHPNKGIPSRWRDRERRNFGGMFTPVDVGKMVPSAS